MRGGATVPFCCSSGDSGQEGLVTSETSSNLEAQEGKPQGWLPGQGSCWGQGQRRQRLLPSEGAPPSKPGTLMGWVRGSWAPLLPQPWSAGTRPVSSRAGWIWCPSLSVRCFGQGSAGCSRAPALRGACSWPTWNSPPSARSKAWLGLWPGSASCLGRSCREPGTGRGCAAGSPGKGVRSLVWQVLVGKA